MEFSKGDNMIIVAYKDHDVNNMDLRNSTMENAFRVFAKFTGCKFINLDNCWIAKTKHAGRVEVAREYFKYNPFLIRYSNLIPDESKGVQWLKDNKYTEKDVGWWFLKYVADTVRVNMDMIDKDSI